MVRRIGRKSEGKVRPILVTFTTYRRKIIVLKNKKLLKDQNIFITEDYPKSVLEIRKNLQEELTEIRKSGSFAFINYDKIVIREDREMKYKNKRRLSPESPKRSSAQEKKIEKRHKIGKSLNQKHNITTFFGSNNEGNLMQKRNRLDSLKKKMHRIKRKLDSTFGKTTRSVTGKILIKTDHYRLHIIPQKDWSLRGIMTTTSQV